MVDNEINAWSSLFFNLETNLILYLYPQKVYKIQPIRVAYQIQKPGNLKFCAPFKINTQKIEGLSDFENLIFLYIPGKSGSSKKFKVSTLNIRIKQSGLKLSHLKFPAQYLFLSDGISLFFLMDIILKNDVWWIDRQIWIIKKTLVPYDLIYTLRFKSFRCGYLVKAL